MTWQVLPGQDAAYTRAQIPPSVLTGIPHQRGEKAVVVKHDYPTWVQMRARGMILPSPIAHYKWPGRFDPFAHQRTTSEFLISHPKSFVFNGLGTGKTLSALWAMDYLMQQKVVRRVLIIAPLAVCTGVWEPELFKTTPHLSAQVLEGGAAKKKAQAARRQTQVVIVNPESLHIVSDELMGKVDLILVDEATYFKNASTKRWKTLQKLTEGVPYLWLMTGTPAPQSPMDAYGLLRLVRKKYISKRAWQNMTMIQVGRFRWVPKNDADKTISGWLRPAIWFKIEDCPDMPEMPAPLSIPAIMTKEQQELCTLLTNEARAMVEDGEISAPNAAVVMSKLIQVQCGGVYGTDENEQRAEHEVAATGYFQAIHDFVDQADTPVLIVAPYRITAKAIEAKMNKAGYSTALIYGDVKKRDRGPILRDFSEGRTRVLVAVPGTMSHGVDGLQNASRFILWAAPPTSAEAYHQTIGRLVRSGQKKKVVIGHIITSTLAKEMFNRLESKARLQDAVLHYIGLGAGQ